MVELDPLRIGNRGSHRYCFANAGFHFGHGDAWALLIDPPPVLAVLVGINPIVTLEIQLLIMIGNLGSG